MVHLVEKMFSDCSVAIVTIFIVNLAGSMFTMGIVVILGVIGDGPVWDQWRHFLNRLFLILPSHAFSDGLLELCKNYMASLVFQRYDIDLYKEPLQSDLILPHCLSLLILSLIFLILNILMENEYFNYWINCLSKRMKMDDCGSRTSCSPLEELSITSLQNTLKENPSKVASLTETLRVNNLSKTYSYFNRVNNYAVQNVSFSVSAGECLALLGKNGAGKSTIFKILSGQMQPSSGSIKYQVVSKFKKTFIIYIAP